MNGFPAPFAQMGLGRFKLARGGAQALFFGFGSREASVLLRHSKLRVFHTLPVFQAYLDIACAYAWLHCLAGLFSNLARCKPDYRGRGTSSLLAALS
jgi:hypothetical protein